MLSKNNLDNTPHVASSDKCPEALDSLPILNCIRGFLNIHFSLIIDLHKNS